MTVRKTKHSRMHREVAEDGGEIATAGKRNYGWRPDLPDVRDYRFVAEQHFDIAHLPSIVDLRSKCPPVYDQGQLGSCTGNAIAGVIQYLRRKQKLPDWPPSRLFIYYNERVLEGTVTQDAGAMIRDGIKSVFKQGAPPEADWPYSVKKFKSKPPAKAYTDAAAHKVVAYQRISHALTQMQGALAAGTPFVLGFSVYESFESDTVARTGTAPMPSSSEGMLGGHAVAAVGYRSDDRVFLCRNSWGPDWGNAGYFTLPFDYLTNSDLSDDFWAILLVR